jgi:hypothetical protein
LDLSANQLISAIVIDFVSRMGVDPRVLSVASATLPQQMHFFSDAELTPFKVNWDAQAFKPWQIEPYHDGVIAFSKTQDETETATVFCRRYRTSRLLITAPMLKDGSHLREAVDALEELDAMGLKIPKESIQIPTVNGVSALEFPLSGLDEKSISTLRDLQVWGGIPHVYASYFYYPLTTQNAAAAFRVVGRNCW